MPRPDAGDTAPDFTLPADHGGTVSLSQFRGKPVVVYFYPKDDTPGCTVEARDFTALKAEFDALGSTIVGISKDPVESHCAFRDKYALSVTLASDVDGKVCEAYGVWVEKNMYGKKSMGIQRATFLIDGTGKVAKVWPRVQVDEHAADVLAAVKALGSGKAAA